VSEREVVISALGRTISIFFHYERSAGILSAYDLTLIPPGRLAILDKVLDRKPDL